MGGMKENVGKASGSARLLVVDDDPNAVALYFALLTEEGYEVLAGSRGDDALRMARADSPDLILLDVEMPDLDGYEATRRLKSDPATSAIPIILVTGLSDPENKLKGFEAGADEFLPKPVDRSELLVRIRTMLRLREYQEQLLNRSLSLAALRPGLDGGDDHGSEHHHVLVLLEDRRERDLVASGLAGSRYSLATASARDDPRALLKRVVDCVVLDSSVPQDLLSAIGGGPENLPILAAVPSDDPELRVRLLDRGVSELLVRPFDEREVAWRVARLLRQRAELKALETRYRSALSAASNDSMTKLSNHGYFRRHLELEVKRSHRQNHPTSLIMVDIDDFKAKNDSFGHAAGDLILIEAAQRIRRSVREIDLPARYGGEEFAVILPYTNRAGAALVAERIRSAIASAAFSGGESLQTLSVTASLGLAVCPDDAASPDDLIRLADELLYRAKESGKNRVCARPGVIR
ncbi:MAG: diguanylate cyclase [Spirochaetia bacterium]